MAHGSIIIQFSLFPCPFLLLRQQLWATLSFILLEDYGMQELKVGSRFVKIPFPNFKMLLLFQLHFWFHVYEYNY